MRSHAVFFENRDRLLNSEVAQLFFAAVSLQAKRLMSNEHFTVDGTLIQAWASQKSFPPKDGWEQDGHDTNFHSGTRSNDTHESTSDPDGILVRSESRYAFRAITYSPIALPSGMKLCTTRFL